MIREHDRVVLTCDLPDYGLVHGDVGVVVHTYKTGGFEVEFVALDGKTVAVVTLGPDKIRHVTPGEIANARAVQRVA